MADVIVEIFGDKDPFKDVRNSSRQFLKVINDLIKKSELLGSTFRKELQGIEFKGLKDVQKLNQQVNGLNKTLKATNDLRDAKVKLDKQVLQAQKEAIKTTNQEIAAEKKKGVVEREAIKTAEQKKKARLTDIRVAQAEIRAAEQVRKIKERENRTLEQSTNAYKRLTRVTNLAQANFKRLAAEFGVNSKQAQNALRRFNKLDDSLRQINNAAKDGRRDVGRYAIGVKGLVTNFKSVATALVGGLGVVEGIRAFVGVLREGLQVSRDFGLAAGKLQAISGANEQQFAALTGQAKELGATTAFTASQVAELQLELSKLGFDPSAIQDATGAVLDFAVATDSDLARSGEVVAATLNAFQLDASQAGAVADIAAKAFSSSALDIEKFATAISAVGPAANAVDVSLERTTAILGKIVDSGIDASTAGTALRNVFIELSDQGLTFEEALAQINTSQNSLLKANELFGKRGAVVAQVIANNKEAIDELDESLQNAKGSAAEAASVIGNTLDGDIKRLQSAFEGLLLEGGFLDTIFRSLTQSITFLVSAISRQVVAFRDFLGISKEVNRISTDQIILQKEQADSTEELLNRYEELTKQESLSVDEKKELEDVQDNLVDLYGLSATSIDKETGELKLNVQAIRDKIAAQRVLEDERVGELLAEEARLKSQIRTAQNSEKVISTISNNLSNQLTSQLTGSLTELGNAAEIGLGSFIQAELKVRKQLTDNQSTFKVLETQEYKDLISDLGFVANAISKVGANEERVRRIAIELERLGAVFPTPDEDDRRTTDNDRIKTIEEITGAINKQREVVSKLEKERNEADEADIARKTEQLRLAQEELDRLESLGDRFKNLKDNEAKIELEAQKRRIQQETLFNRQLEEIRRKQGTATTIAEFEALNETIEELRRKNSTALLQIGLEENEARLELIKNNVDIIEDANSQILDIEEDNLKKIIDLNEINNDAQVDRRKKELEDEESNNETITKNLKDSLKERADAIRNFANDVNQILSTVEGGLAERIQRQLGEINTALEDNKRIQSELRKEAELGNTEANESLTLQIKKEQELEQQRIQLEKRQKQRELAFAFLKIFNSRLAAYQAEVAATPQGQNPPTNTVLLDSIGEFGLTSSLATSIAGFIDGTENIGQAMGKAPLGNVVDNYIGETGGKIFRFDGREAILSPEQNKMRGGLSNDETVKIANQYLKGDLVEKSKVFDTAIAMTNALMALNSAKQGDYSGAVLSSLRGDIKTLTKEIKKLPDAMPVSHSGFNNKTGMVEEIVKRQGRVNTVLERLNRA